MEPKRAARWPVYLTLALLAGVTLIFVVVFISASEPVDQPTPVTDTYADRVDALLANADPAHGEALLAEMDCAACHVLAAEAGIAPHFEGVATRAETRRPPLTAAEYIYESITHPTAYVIEGYTGSMPQNFAERLTDQQLGDIMAYLLTLK